MNQDKPKIKMKVFCYVCKTSEETILCTVNCQKCGNPRIGIEETEEMHFLCRLWASRKGWVGDPKPFSLPGFFQKNLHLLKEWNVFKVKLTNPEALPLPELRYGEHLSRTDAYRYFFVYSGVLSLSSWADGGGAYDWHGIGWNATKDVVDSLIKAYPILDKLACAFVDYHRDKGELAL